MTLASGDTVTCTYSDRLTPPTAGLLLAKHPRRAWDVRLLGRSRDRRCHAQRLRNHHGHRRRGSGVAGVRRARPRGRMTSTRTRPARTPARGRSIRDVQLAAAQLLHLRTRDHRRGHRHDLHLREPLHPGGRSACARPPAAVPRPRASSSTRSALRCCAATSRPRRRRPKAMPSSRRATTRAVSRWAPTRSPRRARPRHRPRRGAWTPSPATAWRCRPRPEASASSSPRSARTSTARSPTSSTAPLSSPPPRAAETPSDADRRPGHHQAPCEAHHRSRRDRPLQRSDDQPRTGDRPQRGRRRAARR